MITEEDLKFLKTRVVYCPDTGELTYVWVPLKKALIGSKLPQGPTKRGYRLIRFADVDKKFLRHHVCYCLGNNTTLKEGMIDHKNRIKYDDRLENLRLATRSQNMMNRDCFPNTATGEKCIYLNTQGNYRVVASKDGKKKSFGTFLNLSEAVLVRDKALAKLHGEYNSGGNK